MHGRASVNVLAQNGAGIAGGAHRPQGPRAEHRRGSVSSSGDPQKIIASKCLVSRSAQIERLSYIPL